MQKTYFVKNIITFANCMLSSIAIAEEYFQKRNKRDCIELTNIFDAKIKYEIKYLNNLTNLV